jgi:hypothetical protein
MAEYVFGFGGKVCKCKGRQRDGGIGVLVVGEMSEGMDVGSVCLCAVRSFVVRSCSCCVSPGWQWRWVQYRIVVGLFLVFFVKTESYFRASL